MGFWCRGGGQVDSVLVLFSKDPSSNLSEVYNLNYVKIATFKNTIWVRALVQTHYQKIQFESQQLFTATQPFRLVLGKVLIYFPCCCGAPNNNTTLVLPQKLQSNQTQFYRHFPAHCTMLTRPTNVYGKRGLTRAWSSSLD